MGTRRTSERGFTLIEILVSLVLGGIAVVGVMALYKTQIASSQLSRHTTEATTLAEDKMEIIRVDNTIPTTGSEVGLSVSGAAGGIYTRVWAISATAEYKEYVVTVSWFEGGATRSTRLLSRRGL